MVLQITVFYCKKRVGDIPDGFVMHFDKSGIVIPRKTSPRYRM
jgi:hypothetical protein